MFQKIIAQRLTKSIFAWEVTVRTSRNWSIHAY